MASAARREIETVVSVPGITLTITEEEASALAAVLMHVAGSPTESRRGLTHKVLRALEAVGVDSSDDDLRGDARFSELTP